MPAFNKVVLVGTLTKDVELKFTKSNIAVTEINLAVNEKVKRGEAWVQETLFVNVTLWGKQAELVEKYLGKGSNILIEGSLKVDQWEDSNGKKMEKLKVVGQNMQFLDGKPQGTKSEQPQRRAETVPPQSRQQSPDADDSDVPF